MIWLWNSLDLNLIAHGTLLWRWQEECVNREQGWESRPIIRVKRSPLPRFDRSTTSPDSKFSTTLFDHISSWAHPTSPDSSRMTNAPRPPHSSDFVYYCQHIKVRVCLATWLGYWHVRRDFEEGRWLSGTIIPGHCGTSAWNCMHLTYQRENEVSNVAECQQGHNTFRKSGSVFRVGTSLAEHCATFQPFSQVSLVALCFCVLHIILIPHVYLTSFPAHPLLCIYMYLQSNSKNERVGVMKG